jgi:hypothetical protein
MGVKRKGRWRIDAKKECSLAKKYHSMEKTMRRMLAENLVHEIFCLKQVFLQAR